MTQLSPSSIYHAQAIALLKEIEKDVRSGELQTAEEINRRIQAAYAEFNQKVGTPLMDYEEVQLGEPPLSAKMNRMWKRIENDLNIAAEQLTYLQAAAIHLHNYLSTEMLRERNLTAKASNKLKTLQLYSSANDAQVVRFGDYFKNLDLVDTTRTPLDFQASLHAPGIITLRKEERKILTSSDGLTLEVLDTSNGFLGNNQEIDDPQTASVNPVTDVPTYTFKAQDNRHAELEEAFDQEPNTWVEYEKYLVSEDDRNAASNFNFAYLDDVTEANVTEEGQQQRVDWADGPADGVLKLDLEFALEEPRVVNGFSFTPFSFDDNRNYAIFIKYVETSDDGTSWSKVSPENVWVAVDANLQTAALDAEVQVGSASWLFEDRTIRYLRIHIEQPRSIPCNIGHLYYTSKAEVRNATTIDPNGPSTGPITLNVSQTVVGGTRVEGPLPPVSDPTRYYDRPATRVGNVVQGVEYFEGDRWVIAMRDFVLEEASYSSSSVLVSEPFRITGVVDRVALEADIEVPDTYDPTSLWVRFYVSPDDGLNWYPISRIQDDFQDLPEILAFNDPLPTEFRETGVTYHQVSGTVDAVRVKVELTRPADAPATTPILRNYVLKVRKR